MKFVITRQAANGLCIECEEPLRDSDDIVTVWVPQEELAHKECADAYLKRCHGCEQYFSEDCMSKTDPNYCNECAEENLKP